jgi:oligosaccharide repeat unit polymerase
MLLLGIFVLAGIALLARLLQRSWRAPAAFFCLVWCLASVPAAVFLPDFVSPAAMFLVVSFAVSVVIGSLAVLRNPDGADSERSPAPRTVTTPALTVATFLLSLGGVGAVIGYVWDAGRSLADLFSLSTWLELALHYSNERYHGAYVESVTIRLLLAANYASAVLAGTLLTVSQNALSRVTSVLPVVAAALIAVLTTAKTPMLLTGVLLFSGSVALRAHPAWRSEPMQRRWIVLSALGAVVGVVAIASLALRYGADTTDSTLLLQRVSGYVFGHMVALSAWLAVENWNTLQPTFGAFSFAGVFEVLGFSQRSPGFYVPIGLNEWSNESNVFSAFRGLIIDFGFFGAWMVAALAGAVASEAYSRLRANRGGLASYLTLSVFYAFSCWSPIVSVLAYNVVLLGLAIAGVTLMASRRELILAKRYY